MAINDIINNINSVQNALNNNSLSQVQNNGFNAVGINPDGLPFNQINNNRNARLNRNIISWFVPQFGIIKMYVNPSAITYNHKKLINKDRTKGGYTLQYWGEELDSISISGTTGSSGIEGINVLYEIYRAEQYSLDSNILNVLDQNDAVLSNIGNSLGTVLGGDFGAGISSLINNTNLSQQTIPSLAELAFGVEMYYNGWVYRGYFDSMVINERADNFLIEYQLTFNATQRRGYRINYFPWSKSATNGPSNYNTPYSFSGHVSEGF